MSRTLKIVTILLAASAVSLIFRLPGFVQACTGLVLAYYFPGFVFLLFAGDRKRERLDLLFFPIILSPVIFSVLVYAFHLPTGDLSLSVKLSMLLLCALLIGALFQRTRIAWEAEHSIPGTILWVCFSFAALVAVIYIGNDYFLVYTDAWHHISVVHEIVDRGIPPLDPRFPDIPIRYMWFYHLFHAGLQELSGLPVKKALASFNILNAFAFPYLMIRFFWFFSSKRRSAVVVALIAVAGLESAAWVLWPVTLVRALFGEVSGAEEISRILGNIELNGARVIFSLMPYGTWMTNLLDKFVTITAFNYTLNLFLFCLILSLDKGFQTQSRIRAAAGIFTAAIGALLFHVVTGVVLILTAFGAAFLGFIRFRFRGGVRPDVFQILVIPAVMLLALIIGMPYIRSLTSGSGNVNFLLDHIHFGHKNLFTIIAPLAVLIPFSIRAVRVIFSSRESGHRLIASWLVALLIICIFTELPGIAENKVLFPLFLMLVPFIASNILGTAEKLRGGGRALLMVWIAILFLVPPVLAVRGFILERPESVEFRKRYSITDSERELFDWISQSTPIDAVIIERNFYNLMPVHARRHNFLLNPTLIYVHDYGGEKVNLYVKIHHDLFSKEPQRAAAVEKLRETGHDYYLVVWEEDHLEDQSLKEELSLHPDWFSVMYENSAGTVYHLEKNQKQEADKK